MGIYGDILPEDDVSTQYFVFLMSRIILAIYGVLFTMLILSVITTVASKDVDNKVRRCILFIVEQNVAEIVYYEIEKCMYVYSVLGQKERTVAKPEVTLQQWKRMSSLGKLY